jgi:protein involved in polysaccharide export with SLBB domain
MQSPIATTRLRSAALATLLLVGAPNAPAMPGASGAPGLEPFASQLFTGNFKTEQFPGFDSDYKLGVGDKVSVRVWGALTFENTVAVDPKGNIFIPQVGPIKVLGVRNADLNEIVRAGTSRVFRTSVNVYAALDTAQPVKVFVTGMAKSPGLYAGVAGDSVLRYIDKAGGIDPTRGSYTRVAIVRGGKTLATINLYDFLTVGFIAPLVLTDGDTIVVAPKGPAVDVSGEVLNENRFELTGDDQFLSEVLARAALKADATHVAVTHTEGLQTSAKYYALGAIGGIRLHDGDGVRVTSDVQLVTMLVRIEGPHSGAHAMVLPYSATLADVLAEVGADERSNIANVQLFRLSVAQRQREQLQLSLNNLQAKVLDTSSETIEAANLHKVEAELALQFIERARTIEPRGQVIISANTAPKDVLLEDGDVLKIPQKTSVVMVDGEVNLPTAVTWRRGKDYRYYVAEAGGFLKSKSDERVFVVHANGSVAEGKKAGKLVTGDQVLVLPEVSSKNIEVARGITQIMYQVAVGAGVLVRLF